MEKTTALILEGGGMRGVFTTGVLDFFLEQDIHISKCLGVSAGACHACSYLSRQQGRSFKVCTDYLNDKNYLSFRNLRKTGNLFGVEMLYHTIPEKLYPIDDEAFINSGDELQAVMTNCKTGMAEYPYVKSLINDIIYVQASSSLPGFATNVNINGTDYLDGGIADSIPIFQSIKQGNKKNIVILTQDVDYIKGENKLMPYFKHRYKKYPEFISTLKNRHNVYNETRKKIFQMQKSGEIFVIAPAFPLKISKTEKDMTKLTAIYNHGYAQAKLMYKDLIKYLDM